MDWINVAADTRFRTSARSFRCSAAFWAAVGTSEDAIVADGIALAKSTPSLF